MNGDTISSRKRARPPTQNPRLDSSSGSPLERNDPEGSGFAHPGRAGLACEACRVRKTRCVGFPVCTWCGQRQQPCIRGQNTQTSPLDAWGQQLLDSLAAAKQDILATMTTARPPVPESRASETIGSSSGHESVGAQPLPTPSAETILTWDVLKDKLTDSLAADLTSAQDPYETERSAQSNGSADTSIGRLKQLRQRFERRFLSRYPVLSIARMQRYVRDVAENDGSWTAESCVVFLACAIALQCGCCVVSGDMSRPGAQQYWTMAERRLGWALDTPGRLVGTQCLCLAGFWHLQNCAPRKARRMFLRAAESASDGALSSDFAPDEMPLVQYLHTLCSCMSRLLSHELGIRSTDLPKGLPSVHESRVSLSPRPILSTPQHDGTQPSTPTPEELWLITSEIQDCAVLERSACRVTSSPPERQSRRALDSFLCQVSEYRLRLGRLRRHLWPVGTSQFLHGSIIARETWDRRLELLPLRTCLGLYLTPHLPEILSAEDGTAHHPRHDLMNELTDLANECVLITAEALRSYLGTWESESVENRESLSSASSLPPGSEGVGAGGVTGSTCHHLEAFISHRRAYTGCLVLLAAHFADKQDGSADNNAYAHCRGLNLPVDRQRLVAGCKRLFLAHKQGSVVWQCGKVLGSLEVQ